MKKHITNLIRKIRLRTWVAIGIIIVLAPLAFAAAYGILGALGGSNATPIAYWNFDEGVDNTCTGGSSDACDSSGNGRDIAFAATTAAPTWQTEDKCVSGKCIWLDGSNDRANTANSPGLPTGDFTYSLWVKPNTSAGTLLMASDGSGGNELVIGINGAQGSVVRLFLNNSDVLSSNQSIPANSWTHIAITRSSSTVTIYINGKADATGTSGATLGFSTCPLLIGVDADASCSGTLAGFFHGYMDEIKIYNTALSQSQIQAEFAGGAAVLGDSFDSNDFLNDGLVGYWPLDESSGNASDRSGNGTTLTNNSSTSYSAGKFGLAIEPDGTADYMEAADNATLSITGSLTLAAWINNDDTTGSQNIIGKWDGTNNSYLLALEGDELRMYIDSASDYQTTTSANLGSNSFVHVAGVYDANAQTIKLYINGVEQASTTTGTIPSSIGDDAGEFVIGADDSSANFFDGHIDEARVYNRAFSPREIKALYNWAPGPIGYWPLNENTGTSTVFDYSGNGTNLTMNGTMTADDWVPGKLGSALDLDGSDDELTASNPSILNMETNNFTLAAWVWRDTATTNDGILSKRVQGEGTTCSVANDRGYQFLIWSSDELSISICDATNGWEMYSTSGVVTTGTWHHVAAVVDRENLSNSQLYLNGVAISNTKINDGSNPPATATISNSANFYVGDHTSASTEEWDGKIDDVRVYNYIRTPQQIVEDMNGGHPTGGSPIGTATSYWNFDELSGTSAFDSNATNSNTLTLSSASWTAAGKFNGAWNGTGSVWLTRADDADFDFAASQDFSLSMWVKSDSATNPGANQFLINKQIATNNPGYRMYYNTSGQIVCEIDDDTSSFPEDSATTTTDYYDGAWHHVVCIRDNLNAALNLYVDGLLRAADTSLSATGDLSNTDSLRIGDDDGDATNSFAGDIDEVKIFRSSLTADQVKIVYNANSAINAGTGTNEKDNISGGGGSGPVGYWKFDEMSGTNVADYSGNNYNAVIQGSGSFTTGKYGGALRTDGSETPGTHARVSTNDVFDNISEGTICTWVRAADTGDAIQNFIGIAEDDNGAHSDILIMGWDTTANSLYFSINDNGSTAVFGGISGLTANQWYHYCVSVDSTGNRMYLNGVETAATYAFGSSSVSLWIDDIDENTTGVSFGCLTADISTSGCTGVTQMFVGDIDEIKFYDYALNTQQISYEYNRGAPLFWYKMDDNVSGNGQTIANNAKNANGQAAGNNGTTDDGANNTGMDCTASGKRNLGCDLDGTDDFISVSSPALPTRDFTYAMWVNPDVAEDTLIMSANSGGSNEFIFLIDGSDSSRLKTTLDAGSADATSTRSIATGTWTHLAVTRVGGTITQYINGIADGTGSDSAVLNFANGGSFCNLYIGADADACTGTLGEYFDGDIDDVRIYGYGLSRQQILQVMNEGAVRFGPDTGSP